MKRCRKVGYRDRIGALLALADTHRSRSSNREECRVYRCGCGRSHLTSQPLAAHR